MLIYDVFYYDRHGNSLGDFDREVSHHYLYTIPKSLKNGETAYARCLNNPHEDMQIDKRGVRPDKRD